MKADAGPHGQAWAVVPSMVYADAFWAMVEDLFAKDPNNAAPYAPSRRDLPAYVQSLLDEEAGVNLPVGHVRCSHRWIMSQGTVVGVSRLRHGIDTPFLAQHAGHVGYDVAPSSRGRGFGHVALAVALRQAHLIALKRVLVYTAEDNAPSRATIERAGGELESVAYSEYWKEPLCKYWVPVLPHR